MPANKTFNKLGFFIKQRPGLEQFIDRVLRPVEIITKKPVFGCLMCGQCVLHSTGLVCPMNCPKNLRNGPCGGVRADGNCEVYPDMECVWTKAYAQSQRLFWAHEIHDLRPPVDWSMQGSSSWLNYLTGRDQITSGCSSEPVSALNVIDPNAK
ncbi:MAG: methylenetetrahydrofolate reductase C-terminal domain-containing protein [Anaerolineales bacterium]|nr:methylenetetrahydrofolate reductase C-terminal domain-containing protein [Anaerolineales bacterium]